MIVNYNAAGWEVITQRAHGILAAQLAAHWSVKERPERWTETLMAIAEHDDAEVELDGEELLTETGGPLNFSMKEVDLDYCKQLFQMAITKSQYIALLTSMHIEFLYGRYKKESAGVEAFLSEQTRLRTIWRKALQLDKEKSGRIYDLMQWCDACSLLITQRQMPPEKRGIEISCHPKKKHFELVQTDDQSLTIHPWPFEDTTLTVRYESRQLTQLQFSNSAAFRKAFYEAPVTDNIWILSKTH